MLSTTADLRRIRLTTSGPTGFDPLSLSPTFYLDMAVNTDANDSVYATMVDSSGNGKDFTTASTSCLVKTNSQNGLRTLLMPGGASDYYTRTDSGIITAGAFYIACVAKLNSLPAAGGGPYADPPILACDSGEFYFGYHNSTPAVGVGGDGGGPVFSASRPASTTGFHLFEGFLDTGSLNFIADGTGNTTGSTPNFVLSNNWLIGSNYNILARASMNLAELFVCNYVPSDANKSNLRTHLKNKWGTP